MENTHFLHIFDGFCCFCENCRLPDWDTRFLIAVFLIAMGGGVCQNVVTKSSHMSLKSSKEATCSRNAHICNVFWGPAWGARGGKSERQSDKTENHHQNRLYLSLFDVEKVRFFIQNALWLYSELCFLCRRGWHFQKSHEKKWSESEKWTRKTLDGTCEGYMCGLGGAKKRKCWKAIGFKRYFLKGQGCHEEVQKRNSQVSRAIFH